MNYKDFLRIFVYVWVVCVRALASDVTCRCRVVYRRTRGEP